MALSEDEQRERRAKARDIITRSNYIALLGIEAERWSEDGIRLRMPYNEALSNFGKEYHGGAIASLIDTAGAAAVWAGHDFDNGLRASTVSMTVNYVGRGEGDIYAHARCVKRGREISFSEIRVEDEKGTLVATGTLIYRIVP